MMRSDSLPEYTSAVSTRVPPAATNVSSISCEVASSASLPKVMVPRVREDTDVPLFPRSLYSMRRTLRLRSPEPRGPGSTGHADLSEERDRRFAERAATSGR